MKPGAEQASGPAMTFSDLTWNARDGILISPSASVRVQHKPGLLLTTAIEPDGTFTARVTHAHGGVEARAGLPMVRL